MLILKVMNLCRSPVALAGLLGFVVGCGSGSSGGKPDASFGDGGDSGKSEDAVADHHKTSDGAHPSDAPHVHDGKGPSDAGDAGKPTDGQAPGADASDAPFDAGPPTTVLLVGVNGSDVAYGSTFTAGKWSAAAQVDSHSTVAAGGGVAFAGPLTGTKAQAIDVAVSDQSLVVETLAWSGSWAAAAEPASLGAAVVLGVPVTGPAGVFGVHEVTGTGVVALDTLDGMPSNWTSQSTPVTGDQATFPTVVVTGTGDPMVLAATSTDYEWSLSTAGTWGASTAVPGVALPTGVSFLNAGVAAVNLVGTSTVVAGFVASTGSSPTLQVASIQAATFASGTWSAPTTVATDVLVATTSTPVFAALPDGTLAMAYGATSDIVKVGFFDGTMWGTFTQVPGVSLGAGAQPLALAPGVAGAVLELVWVDTNGNLNHTRLTNETSVTWSSPTVIDTSKSYEWVSIASGY